MSQERIYNVGLVGTGYMAQKHVETLAAHPRARCSAIYHTPRSAEKAAEWRGRYGFELATDDYERFLSAPDLDLVLVCSPNDKHVSQTRAALRAGKHVFCEKPLALKAAEAARLARLAKESGRVLAVGMNCRFRSQYAAVQQLVEAGTLGRLFMVRGTYLYNSVEAIRGRQKPWWLDEANQPLLVTSGLIHTLDLLVWLAGEVLEVTALGTSLLDASIGDDTLVVCLGFEAGVVGELTASMATVRPNDLSVEAYGEEGSVAGGSLFVREGGQFRESRLEVSQPILDLGLQLENIFAAIEGRALLMNDSTRAARNLRVCESIQQALAEKRSVKVDYGDLNEL